MTMCEPHWTEDEIKEFARIIRAENDELRARLDMIADIAEGSQTANSLPHIAKIARGTDGECAPPAKEG